MPENGTKDQDMLAIEGQRILQQRHEQEIIDLDAPMRQLVDRLDTPGEVSGYQLTSTSIGSPTPINGGSWLITTKTTGTSAAGS